MEYSRYIAQTVRSIPPSGIRRFFDIASEMEDCISLGIGEPDFVTPQNIRDEAKRAIEEGYTHYTSNWGKTELRKKIIAYLYDRIHIEYELENILVTTGTSEALDLVFRMLTEPGDDILIPEPTYVSYKPGVLFAGGNPVPMVMREEDGFKLTPEVLERSITKNSKAVVLAYPNNPTGAIMTRADYERIADIILKHNLIVISDELYGELTYAGEHFSIAELPGFKERTIVINGFSKTYAMTGFRLGYVVGPAEFIAAMFKIHQYTMLCAPTIGQIAATQAIKAEMESGYAQIREMADEYNQRRKLIYNGLNQVSSALLRTFGRFLYLPQYPEHRSFFRGVLRTVARLQAGGLRTGHGLRGIRRGLHPLLLCLLPGKDQRGCAADRRVRPGAVRNGFPGGAAPQLPPLFLKKRGEKTCATTISMAVAGWDRIPKNAMNMAFLKGISTGQVSLGLKARRQSLRMIRA